MERTGVGRHAEDAPAGSDLSGSEDAEPEHGTRPTPTLDRGEVVPAVGELQVESGVCDVARSVVPQGYVHPHLTFARLLCDAEGHGLVDHRQHPDTHALTFRSPALGHPHPERPALR